MGDDSHILKLSFNPAIFFIECENIYIMYLQFKTIHLMITLNDYITIKEIDDKK